MRRTILLLTLVAAFATTPAQAQNNQALSVSVANEALGIAPGDALLTVTTDGKSTRTPDIANFSAGITTIGKTASAAMATNAAAMTRVIAELKAAGVADRDMQTSNLSLNPVFDNGKNGDADHQRITGYQATNTVSVRARAIGATGRIIDALVSTGANAIEGPSFDLDHPEAALDEARTSAMAIARSRADLYARAAGLKVLRIVSIKESEGFSPRPMMLMAAAKAMDQSSTPVASGELSLRVSVTVNFELAPQ